MYYNKDGALRPVATVAGWFPWVTMKTFYQMENVIYRGEQLHSFDAVFSKKGSDGNPERLINSSTGEINKAVFEHWKKYDISYYLRNNWDKLKPVLDKKIRVTVGTKDNFLLNYSVMLLETEMKRLNANMRFDYYPGDHFTVNTPEFQKDGNQFLEQKYLEWLAADPNDN